MAIKIDIVSDVSKVVADTGKLAERYDDVSGTLKDLARAGDKAGDQIEDSFRDGVREAKKLDDAFRDGEAAAKDLDRKADAAFDSITAGARRSGDAVGDSQREGFREASEGLSEFGDEANGTARETAASFDGSAESILGSFQEVAANAFAGFGPAGAAAGLAVAVGIGMAVTAMQEGAEKATAMKQKAVDMVDTIAEAGGDLSKLDLSDTIIQWGREVMEDNWMTFWADEATTKFQEAAKDAKTFGVTARDAIRAASGSSEDSRKFLNETADDWERLTKVIDESRGVTEDGLVTQTEAGKAAQKQRDALSDLRGQAEENIKTTGDAVEIYNIEKDALDATTEAAEKAAEAVQEKADASSNAANAAMDLTTAENDLTVTIAQMTKDIQTNGKNLDINTEAGRANRESLVELASSANGYRDAAIDAGQGTEFVTGQVEKSREAFIKAAEAAGYDATAAAALADSYGLIPGNVETLVQANGTEEATAKIEGIPAAKDATVTTTETGSAEAAAKIGAVDGKEVTVQTKETGSGDVQSTIEAIKGKDVKIDVDDEYTVSEVQKRIDGIRGKDVGISVRLINEQDILNRLAALSSPRTAYVTIQERRGEPVI